MKIHEYQAKEILQQYAIPTPRGKACFSVRGGSGGGYRNCPCMQTFSTRRINEFRETYPEAMKFSLYNR